MGLKNHQCHSAIYSFHVDLALAGLLVTNLESLWPRPGGKEVWKTLENQGRQLKKEVENC